MQAFVTLKPPISLTQPLLIFFLILISFSSAAEDPHSATIRLPSNDTEPCATDRATACPITCFRLDPVYAEDDITYWCDCVDAPCVGTNMAKLVFFQVRNGGSAPLSVQALLLVHNVWLIVIRFLLLFGFF